MRITALSFSSNGTAKQALTNVLAGMGDEAGWQLAGLMRKMPSCRRNLAGWC